MENLLLDIEKCNKCISICGYKKFPIHSHGNLCSNAILVSEAPGKDSLLKDQYWTGNGGRILRECLPENTLLEDLFYLTDIVKCWPNENNENRSPNEEEVSNCSAFLKKEINIINPRLILSFGKTSSSVLTNRDIKITKEHGKVTSYDDGISLLTLLHPSGIDRYMDRKKYKDQISKLFFAIKSNDFQNIEEIFKKGEENEKLKIINDNIKTSNKTSFIIPDVGNQITDSDISKNQIRITSKFKKYFPNESTEIKIQYLNKIYRVRFEYRFDKSHILRLGKVLGDCIKLKPGKTIRMTIIENKTFKIENY